MKNLRLLLFLPVIVFFLIGSTNGQVPNNSFEEWENDEPVNWFSSNAEDYPTLVTRTDDAHSGSFALKIESQQINGNLFIGYINNGADGNGTPVSERYEALNLYYKLMKNTVSTYFWAIVSIRAGEESIGGGAVSIFDAQDNFTHLSVPIMYVDERVPDNVTIFFWVGDAQLDPAAGGSFAVIDDVSFGDVQTDVENDVNNPTAFKLEQNFPNPFNPSTKIKYTVPASGEKVTLKVYNVLGNELATLVDDVKSAGAYEVNFNASSLTSGTYFYKLQTGNLVETKKMIYLK